MRSRCLALLVIALAAAPAAADPVHVPYRALLGSIEIATGALTLEASAGHYALSLDGVMAGSAAGKSARAKVHAAGRIARNALWPDLYAADFDNAGQKGRVALGFASGALAMVAVLPPDPKGSGNTRPPQNQAMGLIDPLSALVMPAAGAHLAPLSACGRTQRIFDGWRRFELTLFPSRSEVLMVAGFPLTTVVCRAELRRTTGTTPQGKSRGVERWPERAPSSQSGLVWLAPVAGGRLLAPVRVEGNFGFGALTVEATDAGPFNAALFASAK